MATTPSVLDQAIARALPQSGGGTKPVTVGAPTAGAGPTPGVLDDAILKALGKTPPASTEETQFSYPAAGPGGGIYTTKMPKSTASQLEEEGRQARINAGYGALATVGGELFVAGAGAA